MWASRQPPASGFDTASTKKHVRRDTKRALCVGHLALSLVALIAYPMLPVCQAFSSVLCHIPRRWRRVPANILCNHASQQPAHRSGCVLSAVIGSWDLAMDVPDLLQLRHSISAFKHDIANRSIGHSLSFSFRSAAPSSWIAARSSASWASSSSAAPTGTAWGWTPSSAWTVSLR